MVKSHQWVIFPHTMLPFDMINRPSSPRVCFGLWAVSSTWEEGLTFSVSQKRYTHPAPNSPDKLKLHRRVTTMGICGQEGEKEETESFKHWNCTVVTPDLFVLWAKKLVRQQKPGPWDPQSVSLKIIPTQDLQTECAGKHTHAHSPGLSKAPGSLLPTSFPSSPQGSLRKHPELWGRQLQLIQSFKEITPSSIPKGITQREGQEWVLDLWQIRDVFPWTEGEREAERVGAKGVARRDPCTEPPGRPPHPPPPLSPSSQKPGLKWGHFSG